MLFVVVVAVVVAVCCRVLCLFADAGVDVVAGVVVRCLLSFVGVAGVRCLLSSLWFVVGV